MSHAHRDDTLTLPECVNLTIVITPAKANAGCEAEALSRFSPAIPYSSAEDTTSAQCSAAEQRKRVEPPLITFPAKAAYFFPIAAPSSSTSRRASSAPSGPPSVASSFSAAR